MPWSSSQLLELCFVAWTAVSLSHAAYQLRNAFALANSKSGPIKPDSMSTRLSIIIGPIQGFFTLTVPIVYIVTLVYCGMQQPTWMKAFAFPNMLYGVTAEGMRRNTIRLLACVLSISLQRFSEQAFQHLGDQYHPIGRREKGRVVQTGPYAWVRHPMYSMLLLQLVLTSFMFWSYVPLVTLVANVAILVFKIPMEEESIQQDEAIREEYRTYMKKVPARLIPNVL